MQVGTRRRLTLGAETTFDSMSNHALTVARLLATDVRRCYHGAWQALNLAHLNLRETHFAPTQTFEEA
jgi:hypothetical protein